MQTHPPTLALLWDESHLWGVLLYRALNALNAPATLVRADQIRSGVLAALRPDMLLVPGGWARLKSLALGEEGRQAIRDYVHGGGRYLGFCGGAGLALASEPRTPFLGLCPWSRKPAKDRLPNFSGHLRCRLHADPGHTEALLPVWWPSQFAVQCGALPHAPQGTKPLDPITETREQAPGFPQQDQTTPQNGVQGACPLPARGILPLASYLEPGPDFWSADLAWSGLAAEEVRSWEHLYGINLDPKRLSGEPCIVHGPYGQGSFVLSYPHLETPDSPQANALLARLVGLEQAGTVPPWNLGHSAPVWSDPLLEEIFAGLWGLASFGQQHFLLFWRTPWLLGWRRGVPGSAINFLLALTWQARHDTASTAMRDYWRSHGPACWKNCQEFCGQVRDYLLLERRILAMSPSSPESSASPKLQQRKQELFGSFPGYGGLYGDILRILDELVWMQGRGSGKLQNLDRM